MHMKTAIIGIGLLVAANGALAQAIDPALTAAIAARDKAGIVRNADEVAKYTTDDYFAVGPNGALLTKKQRIDGLRRPPANPSAPQQAPMRTEAVRMYGSNAAITRMKATDGRQLAVWVKNAQGWQAAMICTL